MQHIYNNNFEVETFYLLCWKKVNNEIGNNVNVFANHQSFGELLVI